MDHHHARPLSCPITALPPSSTATNPMRFQAPRRAGCCWQPAAAAQAPPFFCVVGMHPEASAHPAASGWLPAWLAGWLARRASALTSGCLHEYYLLATCLYGLFAAYSAPPALCFQPATVRGPPPPDPTSQFVGCAVSQPIAAHPFPCAVVFVLYPHCRSPESESAPPKHAARRSCTHAPPSQRSRPSCSAPSRIPLVLRAHAASML